MHAKDLPTTRRLGETGASTTTVRKIVAVTGKGSREAGMPGQQAVLTAPAQHEIVQPMTKPQILRILSFRF